MRRLPIQPPETQMSDIQLTESPQANAALIESLTTVGEDPGDLSAMAD